MSQRPQSIDDQIRRHYAAQSLDASSVDRLKTMIAGTSVAPRRLRWPRYAAAAAVLLVIGISLHLWRTQAAERQSQLVSATMVQLHRKPFTPQYVAEDFEGLKSRMTQLPFTPIEPQRCRQEEYRVVGARYATLAGQQVAQIRLAYVYGTQVTLYEMRPEQFPGLREGKTKLDGIPLTVWQENGLTMALAGEVVE